MWRILLCAAAIAGTALPAQAKCGTKQLEGTWIRGVFNNGGAGPITIEGNQMLVGTTVVGTISQSKNCRVTATVEGTTITGWSDIVPSSSARKPRMIKAGAAGFTMVTWIRK